MHDMFCISIQRPKLSSPCALIFVTWLVSATLEEDIALGEHLARIKMEIVPVHASLPVEIVRDLPLPQLLSISGSGHDSAEKKKHHQMVRRQQLIDFCSVY